MHNYKSLISKKLKKLIKEKFKTQKEFANHFELTERTISNWMNFKNYPTLEFLEKLSNYCNLHISYFFTEDSNSNVINQDIIKIFFNYNDFQKIILKKIKLLIKEKFKTQKEFANRFELTEQTITNWFKCKTLPNLDVLIKIAIRCNLHISYFFTEDSNSNVINQDIFNQVFKLAHKFAEENNIAINGSYFLACYDLVVSSMQKDNVDIETSFNNNTSIILKFMK